MFIFIRSSKNKNKNKIKNTQQSNINDHNHDPAQLQAQQIDINVVNNENINDQVPHAPKQMIIRAPSSSDINVNVHQKRSDVIELAEVIQQKSINNKQHGDRDTNVIGIIGTQLQYAGESDSSDQQLSIVYDDVKTDDRDHDQIDANVDDNAGLIHSADIVYGIHDQDENDAHVEVEGNDLNRYAIKLQKSKINNSDAKNMSVNNNVKDEDVENRFDENDISNWQNWDSSRLNSHVKCLLKRNNNSQEEIDDFMNNFWINMRITGQTLVRWSCLYISDVTEIIILVSTM